MNDEEKIMTRRMPAIACAVLLCAAPVLAQSRGAAKADPISGKWTGELTPDAGGPPPRAVTFELKLGDKGSVSGTFTGMPSPGDVKKGTFDANTNALKLEIGKQGEAVVRLTLDGTVAKGVATGKIAGEGTGTFKLTKKK
jgi:hypothetical protein